MQKKEIIFVYLPNTSHFIHFQSVRQTKGNIHNETNKYRWHFRSKPHQIMSLTRGVVLSVLGQLCSLHDVENEPDPAHSLPPYAGDGLLHGRVRVLVPPPHDLVQLP